jgi:hypothetical protein
MPYLQLREEPPPVLLTGDREVDQLIRDTVHHLNTITAPSERKLMLSTLALALDDLQYLATEGGELRLRRFAACWDTARCSLAVAKLYELYALCSEAGDLSFERVA